MIFDIKILFFINIMTVLTKIINYKNKYPFKFLSVVIIIIILIISIIGILLLIFIGIIFFIYHNKQMSKLKIKKESLSEREKLLFEERLLEEEKLIDLEKEIKIKEKIFSDKMEKKELITEKILKI